MHTAVINMDLNIQLINDCKNGSKTAYEELYRLYVKAMYNISIRITNDSAESEDILQESFLSAFSNIDNLKENALFGSWLKRIVINKSIDFVKKRKLKFISFDTVENIQIEEEFEDESEINYTIESVNKAIKLLPDGFRTVLTLYLFEDYSHKEIAETMGISENTSKTQYLRAKKKLITLLSNNQ